MKKKLIVAIFMVLFTLTACGGETDNGETSQSAKGYTFTSNGTKIAMNTKLDGVVEDLGEPINKFESEACAFQGTEYVYTYSGFELYTYPLDDVDYVLAVVFTDDTISTEEGIFIGDSKEDVIAEYGDATTEKDSSLVYEKEETTLTFLLEDNKVDSIEYRAVIE